MALKVSLNCKIAQDIALPLDSPASGKLIDIWYVTIEKTRGKLLSLLNAGPKANNVLSNFYAAFYTGRVFRVREFALVLGNNGWSKESLQNRLMEEAEAMKLRVPRTPLINNGLETLKELPTLLGKRVSYIKLLQKAIDSATTHVRQNLEADSSILQLGDVALDFAVDVDQVIPEDVPRVVPLDSKRPQQNLPVFWHADPDPQAEGLIHGFLRRIFPDDEIRFFVVEAIAYAAFGGEGQHQLAFFLRGRGGNGKSALQKLYRVAFKPIVGSLGYTFFMGNRQLNTTILTPALNTIRGKKISITDKVKQAMKMITAVFRAMTNDLLMGRDP
ncbi:hypothetical protein HDU96_010260 [Phlyctochytrium bullatum]|nr:hypothetical protein HDU96_010260 [Phlyctochytrium bullatum]